MRYIEWDGSAKGGGHRLVTTAVERLDLTKARSRRYDQAAAAGTADFHAYESVTGIDPGGKGEVTVKTQSASGEHAYIRVAPDIPDRILSDPADQLLDGDGEVFDFGKYKIARSNFAIRWNA